MSEWIEIQELIDRLRTSKSAAAGSNWKYTGFWKDFFALLDLIEHQCQLEAERQGKGETQ